MTLIPALALAVVALVHALPSLGVLDDRNLRRLYGDTPVSPEVALLLRHRAATFATLTAMCVAAIFVTTWQVPVLLFALASVGTFVALWLMSGVRSQAINRVGYVDLALTPVICCGLAFTWIAST